MRRYEGTPLGDEARRIKRRRSINNALMSQALEPYRQTEMVSGHAVDDRWGRGLEKIGLALMSRLGSQRADEEESALADQYDTERSKSVQAVIDAYQGTPEMPYELSQDEQFDGEQIPGLKTAGVEADPKKALLMAGTDPYLQDNENLTKVMSALAVQNTPSNKQFYTYQPTAGGGIARLPSRPGEDPSMVLMDGQPLRAAKYDPSTRYGVSSAMEGAKQHQRNINEPPRAADVAEAKVRGEAIGTAKLDMPATEEAYDKSISLIDELIQHPGFKDAVGFPDNPFTLGGRVPWTNAAGFRKRLDQLTGRGFMEVFPTLKGGGQITEVEGEKAQASINRMSTATTEKEFLAAADDFKRELYRLKKIVADRAGATAGEPPQEASDPLGFR